MNDVTWFDGKSSVGKFILEITFASGGRGYLKNEDFCKIENHCNILWDCPDVVEMTVYNPNRTVISNRSKSKMAA